MTTNTINTNAFAAGVSKAGNFYAQEGYVIAYFYVDHYSAVRPMLAALQTGEFEGEIELYAAQTDVYIKPGTQLDVNPLTLHGVTIQSNEVNDYDASVLINDEWVSGPSGTSGEWDTYTGHGYYCKRRGDGDTDVTIYFAVKLK